MKRLTFIVTILLLVVLMSAITYRARATSLVCDYKGQQLVYTEIDYSSDKDGIKSVYRYNDGSVVQFYSGKQYDYGSIIPCVLINEDRGETTFLEEYLRQFE